VSLAVVLTPDAQDDLDAGHAWYEQQQAGRGGAFLDEVRDRLNEISQRPRMFGRVRGQTRAAQLPHSQYVIYYRIHGNNVVVTAVQHARADPRTWQRRK